MHKESVRGAGSIAAARRIRIKHYLCRNQWMLNSIPLPALSRLEVDKFICIFYYVTLML